MTVTAPTLVSSVPAEPVTVEEFAKLMREVGIAADASLAVAVSGGSDSMALSLLAGEWATSNIQFLTFDHDLRAESAGEARQAGEWLAARGYSHHILRWPQDEPRPTSDVSAAARKARYKALEDFCSAEGIEYLLLAHHLEDQAETLLMRLARGSGVDGLAAMAAVAPPVTGRETGRETPRLARPLLGISKARLVATLQTEEQSWIEDPTNQDRTYLRVQARELLKDMPLDGLTPERLAATARRMARVRALLDEQTSGLLDEAVVLEDAGYASLMRAPLAAANEEIALRLLSRLVASIGGRTYPPRLDGIERLLADIKSGEFSGATLAGCILSPLGQDALLVAREAGTLDDQQEITPGGSVFWDGRFEITLPGVAGAAEPTATAGTIAALGEAGWLELLAVAPEAKKSPIPHAARLALPALRSEGKIAAVPHLIYVESGFEGFSARFVPLRPLYPNSHRP